MTETRDDRNPLIPRFLELYQLIKGDGKPEEKRVLKKDGKEK